MILQDATVLVVDDEPMLNLTLSLLLKQAGARVECAADGAEALEIIARQSVDLMVCDQNMPRMNGETLLRALKASNRTVTTLLFVGGPEMGDLPNLAAMGVRKVLRKPIQPSAFIAEVRSALETLPSTG